MALQCPQCSNSIEADFGVVTCSRCQSVLFVDMEGHVQLSGNSNSDPEPPSGFLNSEKSSSIEAPLDPPSENWSQDQNPVSFENEPVEGFDSFAATNFESALSEVSLELETHLHESQSAPVFEEAASDSMLNLDSLKELSAESEFEIPVLSEENSNDLSDVSRFSNADEPVGPLSYSIVIEAIDTQDIRQQILEALSDPKFQWDIKELMRKIKMGKLVLENMNPVKASIVVHRLQALPVKVSWTQNVYS